MSNQNLIRFIQDTCPTSNYTGGVTYDGSRQYSDGLIYSDPYGGSLGDPVLDGDLWLNTATDVLYRYDSETFEWIIVIGEAPDLSINNYGFSVAGEIDSITIISTIERIEFPFDSGVASAGRTLSEEVKNPAAFNSSTNGYIASGNFGEIVSSTIKRIGFPFDSGTSSVVGSCSEYFTASGINNSKYGYMAGGWNLSQTTSNVQRIEFPFDTGSSLIVGILSTSKAMAGSITSQWHGYSAGGYVNPNSVSYIDRISFPFDSGTGSLVGVLTSESYATTCFNSSQNGYIAGGYDPMAGNRISTISRIAFPFSSGVSTDVGNLAYNLFNSAGCNSTQYGYTMGGVNSGVKTSSISRILFPFNSGIAVEIGTLSQATTKCAGLDGTDFVTQFV